MNFSPDLRRGLLERRNRAHRLFRVTASPVRLPLRNPWFELGVCNSLYVYDMSGRKKRKDGGHLRSSRFASVTATWRKLVCRLSTTSSTVETVPRPRSVQRSKPQTKTVLYDSAMPGVELDGQKWSRVTQSHRNESQDVSYCILCIERIASHIYIYIYKQSIYIASCVHVLNRSTASRPVATSACLTSTTNNSGNT